MPQIKLRNGLEVLPLINVRLAVGKQSEDKVFDSVENGGAYDDKFSDYAGNLAWPNPLPSSNGYTLWVNYANINGKYTTAFMQVDDLNHDIDIQLLKAKPETLSRLAINSRYFYNEFGQRVFLKCTTDFMLYKYFLEGNDISPILRERNQHGCNAVRPIGMVSWFDYTPQKYGNQYYDEIPDFLDLCNDNGLYVYFTVFADTEVVMPRPNDQIDHFNKMVAQLKSRKNAIGELVNEPYTGTNATADPLAFTRPSDIAFSSGSYNDTGGVPSPKPYWDFHDYHSPRKDTKRVKDCSVVDHPNYTQKNMAIMIGEPDKFGGPNAHNPQIYLTDVDESRKMYFTALGSAAGYTYHTSAGNFSVMWNDTERVCCPFLMEY